MYKIKPESYASVFALPTQIADKHLRLAGKAQLKVLLWLYRNPASKAEAKRISADTGIPYDEIDDAMLYWIEAGLIEKVGGETSAPENDINADAAENASKASAETKIPTKEKFIPDNVSERKIYEDGNIEDGKNEDKKNITKNAAKPIAVKPSIDDIARRIEESDEIRSMFEEAQETFGRTLGYDAQASLLILHDHYSLPAEVIIMLCNYAKTIGKQGSLAYIMRIGEYWSRQEINTFDRAAAKIQRMENADKIWGDFKRLTGVENPRATVKQSEYLEKWADDYGFSTDIICYAYEKTVEKKGSISFHYMNGILSSWHECGLKTIEDIERSEREFAEGTKKSSVKSVKKNQTNQNKKNSGENGSYAPPSFDVELALKRSRELDPTKTKKGQ